jgi:hypothetical protein
MPEAREDDEDVASDYEIDAYYRLEPSGSLPSHLKSRAVMFLEWSLVDVIAKAATWFLDSSFSTD